MPFILQIESSTSSCSVALSADGKVIALKEIAERNVHASHITLFIDHVMKESGRLMTDLDAVAISMGPGSYTGLRIGVSTAKGICYALDIPLLAVHTLQSMAAGLQGRENYENTLFCPMIDARRMEVYSAIYNDQLELILPVEARIINSESFSELLSDNKIVFFGDGAMKCEETLGSKANAIFVPDFINSAADMTQPALAAFLKEEFQDTAYFEPYYLKDFLAGPTKKNPTGL